jgi:hypothetical protein
LSSHPSLDRTSDDGQCVINRRLAWTEAETGGQMQAKVELSCQIAPRIQIDMPHFDHEVGVGDRGVVAAALASTAASARATKIRSVPSPAAMRDTAIHVTRHSLAWPMLTATGIAWFVLAAAALHALRPDLDAIDSQMSLYLIGAWGPLLQSAYAALGVAMIGLAVALHRVMSPDSRSAAPVLMFVCAGVSLTVTAYAWMDLPGADASLEGLIHGMSAQGAFLFATTAIVLQALRFRLDPAWRGHVRWLLPWAVACFAAIWVLALWREAPRGLAQKAVIAMIVGWLAAVAALLWRRTCASPWALGS